MAGATQRSRKAGTAMGKALIEMVHLMYQNNTARHFLFGLINVLLKELKKREETENEKKGS